MSAPGLTECLDTQAGIVGRGQALCYLTEDQLGRLLGKSWQVVFPGVYAAFSGPLNEQQRLWAAKVYCGDDMLLTDRHVLLAHDVRYVPDEDGVHVLLPWTKTRKPRAWLHITRTRHVPQPLSLDCFPAAPLDRALIDFGLRNREPRTVLAVFADAVQRRKVAVSALEEALALAPPRGRRATALAVEALRAGIRSAPEQDFRLISRRVRTPVVLFNPLLQLPSGRRISPDALIEECGLVHESNGRAAHEEEDLFESMQERHDVMTSAGLTALHNSPRRLLTAGDLVEAEWRQCAARLAGRGLPPGVVILRRGPDG